MLLGFYYLELLHDYCSMKRASKKVQCRDMNPGPSEWKGGMLSTGYVVVAVLWFSPGVRKRCRLSWLTNSVLLYEPKWGEEGGGGFAGSQPCDMLVYITLCACQVFRHVIMRKRHHCQMRQGQPQTLLEI